MSPTRREFVATSAAMLASTALVAPASGSPLDHPLSTGGTTGAVVLFQGDSITDVGRDRHQSGANDQRALGGGYPLLVAAALCDHYAARQLQVLNRGVSGNTVADLQSRWTPDTIDLKPAVLSILIGVNDIWHTLTGGYNGTPEKYQAGYRELLDTTRTALPGARLVVLEPFVLRTGAVSDSWFPEFDRYRAAAAQVAHDGHATFIHLHDMFQHLARETGPSYWLADGVHPTLAGHDAIARRWLEAVTL